MSLTFNITLLYIIQNDDIIIVNGIIVNRHFKVNWHYTGR